MAYWSVALKPKVPSKIQVGPFVYGVRCDEISKSILGNDHGDTDSSLLEIRLNSDSADLVKREVLLHETLHAITAVAGLDHELTEEVEEKFVRRIAPILFDVLLRNPKLVDYLLGSAE